VAVPAGAQRDIYISPRNVDPARGRHRHLLVHDLGDRRVHPLLRIEENAMSKDQQPV
jgi:hypothetical protein